MKILVLGDTHGRDIWKYAVKHIPYDKVIFIGDYFDSREDISSTTQLSNFNDIISFKRDNIDKVVLLIGNHDHHYFSDIGETYSGYQFNADSVINGVLSSAFDDGLLQIVHLEGNYLFSHAGLTKTWVNNRFLNIASKDVLVSVVNDMYRVSKTMFNFSVGDNFDNYGDDITQSPIWVRPKSLYIDGLNDYIHVVGHTSVPEIRLVEKDGNPKIIMCDTFAYDRTKFLVIDNNDPLVIDLSNSFNL